MGDFSIILKAKSHIAVFYEFNEMYSTKAGSKDSKTAKVVLLKGDIKDTVLFSSLSVDNSNIQT